VVMRGTKKGQFVWLGGIDPGRGYPGQREVRAPEDVDFVESSS